MHFNKGYKSPVSQDLMYLAEYGDGSFVTEFDLVTCKNQPFKFLNRVGIMRFGLVGVKMPLYIETFGGFFHVAGRNVQVKYLDGSTEYPLIGGRKTYSNVIYYKTGESTLNMSPREVMWGANTGNIVSYHIGYQEELQFDEQVFSFEAECVVPYQSSVYFTFKLHSNIALDGYFVIIVNGKEVYKEYAPVDIEAGGEVNWEVI